MKLIDKILLLFRYCLDTILLFYYCLDTILILFSVSINKFYFLKKVCFIHLWPYFKIFYLYTFWKQFLVSHTKFVHTHTYYEICVHIVDYLICFIKSQLILLQFLLFQGSHIWFIFYFKFLCIFSFLLWEYYLICFFCQTI